MRARVLGPLELERTDGATDPPSGRVGLLLQALLLRPNFVRSPESLARFLWEDEPPAGRGRLHVTVSRLRKFLSDDPGGLAVSTRDGGYVLSATAASLDRIEFEEIAARALRDEDPDQAAAALGLWRGDAYTGFPVSPDLTAERTSLVELRNRLVRFVAASRADPVAQPPKPVSPRCQRSELLTLLPSVGQVPTFSIVAPAGYGKTVLMSQWMESQDRPVAWVRLTEADNDPGRLHRKVTSALRRFDSMGADDPSPATGIGLVLDDVHLVTDTAACNALAGFGSSLGLGSTVVYVSRHPLRWSSGPEVTAGELAFKPDEIAELVDESAAARRIWDLTRGWPVAVCAMVRGGVESVEEVAELVQGYVGDELVGVLSRTEREWLWQLASVDQFDDRFCGEVLEMSEADPVAALAARGIPMAAAEPPGWYRVNPVVAAALRSSGPTPDREFHARVARWFTDRGMRRAALTHARRARRRDLLVEVAGDVLAECALRGEVMTGVEWLRGVGPPDLEGEDRAHGLAVYLATLWMGQIDKDRWVRSRLRTHDPDVDVILLHVAAVDALRQGRSTEAIGLAERVVAEAPRQMAEAAPELVPLLIGNASATIIQAQVLQEAHGADDPAFDNAVEMILPYSPMSAAWLVASWAFTALVAGDEALASSLEERFFQLRRTFDVGRPTRRDNSLLGALLESRSTADPTRLRNLAEGLTDLIDPMTERSLLTELSATCLVIAHLYRRAGDHEAARPFQQRADALLQVFEDAPLLKRLDDYLSALESAPAARRLERLTFRQRAVLRYLATDLTNIEIARALGISPQTLRSHTREIFRRLGVRSRHQAVLAAAEALGPPSEEPVFHP